LSQRIALGRPCRSIIWVRNLITRAAALTAMSVPKASRLASSITLRVRNTRPLQPNGLGTQAIVTLPEAPALLVDNDRLQGGDHLGIVCHAIDARLVVHARDSRAIWQARTIGRSCSAVMIRIASRLADGVRVFG